jgi:SAM-dependent methyltransferase
VNRDRIERTYRRVDLSHYPELEGYSREDIYWKNSGSGGLFLAARMARSMELSQQDLVLDLGCGMGASSLFLAERYGAEVVGIDLWAPVGPRKREAKDRGLGGRITYLQMDATEPLPLGEGTFDAVFCMNALHLFGRSIHFLRNIAGYVKTGGVFCVGMETLNEELDRNLTADVRSVYSYDLPTGERESPDVWARMHSPPWWRNLFDRSGVFEVTDLGEIEDARVLIEDLFLYDLARNRDRENLERRCRQIEYGRDNRPYITLFTLTARRV